MGQFECESVQFERVKPFSQPFWLEGLTPTGTIAQGQTPWGTNQWCQCQCHFKSCSLGTSRLASLTVPSAAMDRMSDFSRYWDNLIKGMDAHKLDYVRLKVDREIYLMRLLS